MWREQMRLNAADTPVKREHWDLQTGGRFCEWFSFISTNQSNYIYATILKYFPSFSYIRNDRDQAFACSCSWFWARKKDCALYFLWLFLPNKQKFLTMI